MLLKQVKRTEVFIKTYLKWYQKWKDYLHRIASDHYMLFYHCITSWSIEQHTQNYNTKCDLKGWLVTNWSAGCATDRPHNVGLIHQSPSTPLFTTCGFHFSLSGCSLVGITQTGIDGFAKKFNQRLISGMVTGDYIFGGNFLKELQHTGGGLLGLGGGLRSCFGRLLCVQPTYPSIVQGQRLIWLIQPGLQNTCHYKYPHEMWVNKKII